MEEPIAIDGSGRLVIPKELRKRFGLRAGSRIRLIEDGARILLEPVEENAQPVEVDGLLVIRGRLHGDVPDHRTIRNANIERFIKDR